MAQRIYAFILLYFLLILVVVKYLLVEINYNWIDRYARSLISLIPSFAYNMENQTRNSFLLS